MGSNDRDVNGAAEHASGPAEGDRNGAASSGDLAEWKARYEAAVRAGQLILYDWDLARGQIVWGGEVERILGYRPEEMGDARWAFEQIHPEDRAVAEAESARAFATHTPGAVQYRVRCRNGKYIHVEDCTEYLPGNSHRSARLIGFIRDVTEERRAEDQLRQLNEVLERRVAERTAEAERRAGRIRELAGELTRSEHRERQRLARLLHDHLQQYLVAARLRIEALLERTDDEKLLEIAREVEQLLRDSSDAARSLAVELSPPILHERGLVAALSWLADWMRDKHALSVQVETDERAEPADETLRTLLFEIARELLFNVVKHAKTDRARVRLARSRGDELEIVVADEGIGLDPQGVEAARQVLGGFGLSNIRQRLDLIGGRMEITAAPGQGCRIRICAPAGSSVAGAAGSKTRVLLVDGETGFRRQLADLLRGEPDIEVVGEADDGPAAVELARRVGPHVVVAEANLPGLSGVEVARRVLSELPQAQAVGLSREESEETAHAFFDAGVGVYLAKNAPLHRLIEAIRSVRRV